MGLTSIAVSIACLWRCFLFMAAVEARFWPRVFFVFWPMIFWEKGTVLRKYSLHWEKGASVLLRVIIDGNEICHTTDTPIAHERNSICKCWQHTIHDPKRLEQCNNTMIHNFTLGSKASLNSCPDRRKVHG